MVYRLLIIILFIIPAQFGISQSGLCDTITPFYEVNLVGNPGGTWISDPPITRDGHCCGITGSAKCIEFEITLDPNATAITFEIVDGAIPPGALFYQLNCGPEVQVGEAICIETPGPHTLTFCKPGNNVNVYAVNSIPAPNASPDLSTAEGCSVILDVTGLNLNSIEWTSIFPGTIGQYNSLLSCTSNCEQTTVSPPLGSPGYIDYQVCGVPVAAACSPNPTFCDTIRIFISDPIEIEINPNPAVYCSIDEGILLTADINNGTPPYNFTWIDPNGLPFSTSDTAFATIPGNYQVLVSDQTSGNCQANVEIINVQVQDLATVNAGEDISICPTNPMTILNGTVSNSNFGLWTGPGGFFIPSNVDLNTSFLPSDATIASGSYELYLTSEATGICPAVTDTLLINVTDSLTLDFLFTPINCYGNSTNLIGLAQGASAPYTFLWNTGASGAVIGAESGVYELTIEDQLGCVVQDQIILNDPPEIQIDLISSSNSNCGQNNGSICINASGGTGSLDIVWDNLLPINGNCVENLYAGCYGVQVTDSNGCSKDSIFCVTDIEGPEISLISQENISCYNAFDGKIFIEVTAISLPLTVHWYNEFGDELLEHLNQVNLFNLLPGCYTVKAVDAAGCEAYGSYCLYEPSVLVSNIETESVSCYGLCNGSVLAYASGGTGPYAYNWSAGNFPNSSFNNAICTGDINLTVTDNKGCTAENTAFIDSPEQITLSNFNQEEINCFGECNGALSVEVTGGTNPIYYHWVNSGVNGPNLANICAGDYNLEVSDINGCDTSFFWTLTQPDELILDYSKIDATCGDCNGSAEVTVTGGIQPYDAIWSSGQNTMEVNGILCANNYSVQISDSQGCNKEIEFNISTIAGPDISGFIATPPGCFEDNNGSLTVIPSGGQVGGDYNFQWNSSAFFQITGTAANLSSGYHCVAVSDDNNCEVNECFFLPEPTPVEAIGIGDTDICFGEETDLYSAAIGGTSPYDIVWLNGANLGDQGIATVNPEASFEYCFVIVDANGCTSPEACMVVQVSDALTVVAANGFEICAGLETEIIANLGGGNNDNPFEVQWFENSLFGPLVSSTENGNISTASIIPTEDTYYYILLDDGCSTSSYDSVLISTIENPQPTISTENNLGCAPLEVSVYLDAQGGLSYNYDFDCDGEIDLISDTTVINYSYEQAGVYDLCVSVFNPTGCFAEVILQDEVHVYPSVQANFSSNQSVVTSIGEKTFEFFDESENNITNTWNFGDMTEISGAVGATISTQDSEHSWGTYSNPTHKYVEPGTYFVNLLAANSYGCNDEASLTVKVEDDFTIYAPNAFTPDASGTNDAFFVVGYNIENLEFELKIFDRWGSIVFESDSPDLGWDGTNGDGYYLKSDVYVWRVVLRDPNGNNHKFQGHVTLIR